MKLFALVFSLLIFLGTFAAAEKIEYFGLETVINPSNIPHEKITLTLEYPAGKELVLPFFTKVSNLRATSNFGNAACSAETKPYGTDIVCSTTAVTELNRSLIMEFDLPEAVKGVGEQLSFKQEFYAPLDTETLSVQVTLPEGTGLVKDKIPYIPSDGQSASDGRKIYLFWKHSNISAGQTFATQVSFEPLNKGDEFPLAFFIPALAAVGGIGFYFYRRSSSLAKLKVLLPILKPDEKKVIESLLSNKGIANQKVIVRESGYSKAKVSKVLKNLHERGLVQLERLGRSNKVYLTSDVKKEEQKPSGNNQKEQKQSDSSKTILGNNNSPP
ncbi:MAG TPA: helix-turn-helix domain-containing protein [archaeon]|nr:helix-turn-helix domain-containing protein [archaeon]